MNNKLCSLIYHFIDKIPNLNKTEIVKLSYLADYNFYKYFSKDITGITYKYHNHGPFSKSVHDCIEGLEEENILKQSKNVSLNKQREYFSFELSDKYDIEKYLNKQELEIVDFIVSEYGKLGFKKLTEVSYNTEPMKNAKRGDNLNFKLINKSVENKIADTRKEVGSTSDFSGEPPEFEGNDNFIDYQYSIISK